MHTYRKTSAYSTKYCLLTKAKYLRLISYTMYSLRKICKNNYTMYSLCRIQKVELYVYILHKLLTHREKEKI
jgi:hypothetical protein